jgi:transcriptional regulator with XRE-family HTH domain
VTRTLARTQIGDLLREWRVRRHQSQLDVSVEVGVSTRHLSYVETGRSRPSPELVLALAEHLDVPLRERNGLLLAAGYAPRFGEATLDDPAMTGVRAAIQRMLDAHSPYPGLVVDRQWNLVLANDAATALVAGLPAHLLEPPINVYRVSLHPDGLAGITTNLAAWAVPLVRQLRRAVVLTGDAALESLHDEVTSYPAVATVLDEAGADVFDGDPPLLVPFDLRLPGGHVSMYTTLTTFGTPLDITLSELCIELFYPADDASADVLRGISA